ncbi:hypothetical protein A2U01_0059030, partial [Trifolium medium]|nr:hypothetical protein [Trifolium medium]
EDTDEGGENKCREALETCILGLMLSSEFGGDGGSGVVGNWLLVCCGDDIVGVVGS